MPNVCFLALTIALALLLGTCAQAKIMTQTVPYQAGETALQGYLAYDDASAAKRPGVIVFPEWWGLNDYPKMRARQLAEMGYVALAADMYGGGKVAADAAEAGKLAGQFRGNWDTGGRTMMRERAQASLRALQAVPQVDPARLAAIGFCFGGTTALELAYSGAPLAGVVSFHGGLNAPQDADLPLIKTKLLILHGADDPSVKPETITATQEAFRKGRVDWEMVYYGGTVHAFTNPANVPGSASAAYNPQSAARAWQAMTDFFKEVLR